MARKPKKGDSSKKQRNKVDENSKKNSNEIKEVIDIKNTSIQNIDDCKANKTDNSLTLKNETSQSEKIVNTSIKEKKERTKKEQQNIMNAAKEEVAAANLNRHIKENVCKGATLEYRMKRLLFFMGYYPKVGIKLKTSNDIEAHDITDLDVYGIYIHRDFRKKSVWVDCKSGKTHPLEHILWIKGVRDSFCVDDILFVKRNVKYTIKEFAREQNIQILDLALIETLEKNYLISDSDWRGSWNPIINSNKLKELTNITIPNNINTTKVRNFISFDFWNSDTYSRVKKCITAFRLINEIPMHALSENELITIKWAIYELTTLFTLSILDICKELYYFSEMERSKILLDRIISGEISLKKRQNILKGCYRLTYQIIRAEIPNFVMPPRYEDFNILNSPPGYFEPLLELINRVLKTPNYYYDILRFLDFTLFEYDLQNKRYDINELNKVFQNTSNNILGAKTILNFISQIIGIERSVFKILNTDFSQK